MKRFWYFLMILIILSACVPEADQTPAGNAAVSSSGVERTLSADVSITAPEIAGAQESAGAQPSGNVTSNLQASSFSISASGLSAVSQTGEAFTPFQLQLEQAINLRKAAGLPVPSSVKFENQATTSNPSIQMAPSATSPMQPEKIISKTVIVFDNPEQAGYAEWPAMIVEDNLPAGVQGNLKTGDYTEAYREFMEKNAPGYWDKYQFGHEPRMTTIVETYEITYPKENLLSLSAILSGDATTLEQLLMGFTYTGPHLDYAIEESLEDPIFGFEIFYFKAGFELDWALGLRLPGQADLTGPDQMAAGTVNTLSSAFTPLDWSPASYSNVGVAPENGNEFVLRMNFFVGVEGHLLGIDLCSTCHVTVKEDFSTSFTTPFGPGSFFPIPPVNIPIYNFDLSLFKFGAGLKVDPNLGTDKITANWLASGDASGSGTINYTNPGAPVSISPVTACNLGPDNLAKIKVDEFRYWFNQFLIDISATLKFELFGYGVWNPTFSIISLNLSSLSSGMYLGGHKQCDWDFTCTAVGPDNRLDLSIPVVDLTPPATTLTPAGTAGNHGWYVSNVQVSLSASDLPAGCGSGIEQIEYSFDGTTWNIYTLPFTISTEGATTVYYRSTDMEGNVELAKTQVIKIDKTPPIITGAPTTAANVYGWYNSDVIVHFEASDAVSGIDTVTPDQTLSAEGANQSVTGTAVDMAGLSASFTVSGINIDKTKPSVTITSPEAKVYANTETFNVTWIASDSLSGVASENGTIDGNVVTNNQLIVLLLYGPGPHSVVVEVIDKADNANSATVVFSVSVDSDGLLAALEYICDLGMIDKQGICNSLEAKLNAEIASLEKGNLKAAENQLEAFINELEAQKDKSISQAAYDVLKADALYVIEHLSD